jgi:hypothetical protein
MSYIIPAIVIFLFALASTGCASKEYHMKECKQVLDLDGKETGEKLCKKYSIWD